MLMIPVSWNEVDQDAVEVSPKEKASNRLFVDDQATISEFGQTGYAKGRPDWALQRLVGLLGSRSPRFRQLQFPARLASHEPYDEG